MIAGLVFSLVAIAFLVWVMLRLAIFALPAWLGLSVFLWSTRGEIGPFVGALLGLAAGVTAILAGRMILASRLCWPQKAAFAALFAVPAGIAGFSVVSGLMQLGGAGEVARDIAGWLGALAIGMAALASLALPASAGLPDRSAGAGTG